ncbi:amino acid ABC transporter ATP-binding protein [Jiella marina]|uniref:amino acid ABC transporter ATP-binding protein n=1 Tax=Jiella sp. LLJ827 TaxID=2917712 RepID=UPI002100DA78|nr:amino acid ABC transporter ATP-binding protein [Jiella sp. LLJ827]MCQ0988106.1 amino acid ABC transporter ATP-binding protein [Jiella sp. LLJ827]
MTRPAVTVRDVHKSFGKTEVLKGIDLAVPSGSTTCILGPSGSGKSTLLRCIAFLEETTSGIIEIHGEPLGFADTGDGGRTRLPSSEIRKVRARIGMVFQQFNLWPHMTALGNVTEALVTVRKMKRKDANEIGEAQLARVGLSDRGHHYPAELSGGQQQRVAIARALALEPDILLFDEPTSSLDPELTGEVLNVMRELAGGGMTMIVVSHEIGFAASVGDKIVFLDEGKLLLDGPPSEIFATPRHPRLQQFMETYLDRGAATLL